LGSFCVSLILTRLRTRFGGEVWACAKSSEL
jgi:hypothetical protein